MFEWIDINKQKPKDREELILKFYDNKINEYKILKGHYINKEDRFITGPEGWDDSLILVQWQYIDKLINC